MISANVAACIRGIRLLGDGATKEAYDLLKGFYGPRTQGSCRSAGFSYRGAGKVRRRLRRRARSRTFTSARTATRNLDLPLAIDCPRLLPMFFAG